MGVHGSNDTETFKDTTNKDYINNDFVKAEIGLTPAGIIITETN